MRYDPDQLQARVTRRSAYSVRRGDTDFPARFDLELKHPTWPIWAVTLTIAIDTETGPLIAGVVARDHQPPPREHPTRYQDALALIAATWPVKKLLQAAATEVAALLAAERIRGGSPDLRFDLEGTAAVYGQEAVQEYVAFVETAAGVAPSAAKDAGPRRRRRLDVALLRDVAKVYRRAHKAGQPPTAAVAEHFVVSHSTAARWVSEARKAGSLGPAAGTRPGEVKGGEQ